MPLSVFARRLLTTVCGQLEMALNKHGPAVPVIAIEATGSLHRPWVTELERRHPGSVRLFAPSEMESGRTQLGSGRFKTDNLTSPRRRTWHDKAAAGAARNRHRWMPCVL